VTDGRTDGRTDGQTDRITTPKTALSIARAVKKTIPAATKEDVAAKLRSRSAFSPVRQ